MPGGKAWWWISDLSGSRAFYGTSAQANTPSPGKFVEGPFQTPAEAKSFGATGSTNVPGAGTSSDAPKPPFGNPLTGLAAIGDFFQRLTQKNTWTRVGEVALGGILLYAGIRAISHGSTVAGAGARQSAARPIKRATKTVARVAVPEARLATRTISKKAAPKTTARVASHRAQVAKYGAKKPYEAPAPRKPIRHEVVRTSHIIHHKAGS
jgi:hypothetical protein